MRYRPRFTERNRTHGIENAGRRATGVASRTRYSSALSRNRRATERGSPEERAAVSDARSRQSHRGSRVHDRRFGRYAGRRRTGQGGGADLPIGLETCRLTARFSGATIAHKDAPFGSRHPTGRTDRESERQRGATSSRCQPSLSPCIRRRVRPSWACSASRRSHWLANWSSFDTNAKCHCRIVFGTSSYSPFWSSRLDHKRTLQNLLSPKRRRVPCAR